MRLKTKTKVSIFKHQNFTESVKVREDLIPRSNFKEEELIELTVSDSSTKWIAEYTIDGFL